MSDRLASLSYQSIKPFFEAAAEVATKATCLRAKCGTVIVKDGKIIGTGYNAPPQDDESQRLCSAEMNTSEKPKYDKTCCVHAEWRAILNACKAHPEAVEGARLYFMRVDPSGNFTDAGEPFCTVCSRLAMESGIAEFALYNNDGADIYTTDEYNLKSFEPYVVS